MEANNTESDSLDYRDNPVALFVNNINIDPNMVLPDEVLDHIKLTKEVSEHDSESIDTIVEGFMKPDSRYKLFCFGEICLDSNHKTNQEDISIDKTAFYQTLIQEILNAEKNATREKTETLSISFPINNFDCFFDIYDLGSSPVFGNGDLLFVNGKFYYCNGDKITEIHSEKLQEIIG
jgi:hypothetical protein